MSKLDVSPPYNPNGIYNPVGKLLHPLLQGFRDGEHGGNAEAVAGMHAHGINVFDKAHGDLLILLVPYNFKLKLLPSEN